VPQTLNEWVKHDEIDFGAKAIRGLLDRRVHPTHRRLAPSSSMQTDFMLDALEQAL
jgi:hypothetical protein